MLCYSNEMLYNCMGELVARAHACHIWVTSVGKVDTWMADLFM